MTTIDVAVRHHVLPVVREGDTLIISPVGDLTGFGTNEMQTEMDRIIHLLDDPSIRNAVIDLSTSNYYGTAILSVFFKLRDACQTGQTVLCDLSEDMQVVLELFKLEESFPVYETRREAISQVARIPLGERLWAKFRVAKSLIAVVLLIGCVWAGWSSKVMYQIVGSPVQDQYRTVLGLWDEYQSHNAASWPTEERAQFHSRAIEQMDRAVAGLEAPKTHEEVTLLSAVTAFKSLLSEERDARDCSREFMHYMHCTRAGLKRRTGLSVPAPTQSSAETSNALQTAAAPSRLTFVATGDR